MQVRTIETDIKRERAEIKKDLGVSMNNISTSASDKFIVQVIKVYFASFCKIWWIFSMFLLAGAVRYRRAII